MKNRYEWYQTLSHVFINIFAKNIKKEDTNFQFKEKKVIICNFFNNFHL